MSSYHALRVGVVAVVVVVLLAAIAPPVQAQPVRPTVAKVGHVAGVGERVWHLLVSLWTRTFEKEGTSIDPDGVNGATGSTNPPDLTDEGMTIDPNGHA